MSEKPEGSRRAGGWSTRRDPDGILLYVGSYKVGVKEEDKEKPVWIDKSAAIRLAHTVLEAVCRFWDIEVYPEYVRNNTKQLAENVGLEVKEPYREGCPFCQHVSDSEAEMREHLKEHEIHLVYIEEEPSPKLVKMRFSAKEAPEYADMYKDGTIYKLPERYLEGKGFERVEEEETNP